MKKKKRPHLDFYMNNVESGVLPNCCGLCGECTSGMFSHNNPKKGTLDNSLLYLFKPETAYSHDCWLDIVGDTIHGWYFNKIKTKMLSYLWQQ